MTRTTSSTEVSKVELALVLVTVVMSTLDVSCVRNIIVALKVAVPKLMTSDEAKVP